MTDIEMLPFIQDPQQRDVYFLYRMVLLLSLLKGPGLRQLCILLRTLEPRIIIRLKQLTRTSVLSTLNLACNTSFESEKSVQLFSMCTSACRGTSHQRCAAVGVGMERGIGR